MKPKKEKKDMRNACYDCKYCGKVPGSAHNCCNHPARLTGIKVEGDPHGVKSGWFLWPLNFDPVWLIKCSGFKMKGGEKK